MTWRLCLKEHVASAYHSVESVPVREASFHAMRTPVQPCREVRVAQNSGFLPKTRINLPAVGVSYLGSNPSTPVEPSNICSLGRGDLD